MDACRGWLEESELPKLLLHAHPGTLVRRSEIEWATAHLSRLETVNLGEGLHHLHEDHLHQIGREPGVPVP
jgi:hypothetical protein